MNPIIIQKIFPKKDISDFCRGSGDDNELHSSTGMRKLGKYQIVPGLLSANYAFVRIPDLRERQITYNFLNPLSATQEMQAELHQCKDGAIMLTGTRGRKKLFGDSCAAKGTFEVGDYTAFIDYSNRNPDLETLGRVLNSESEDNLRFIWGISQLSPAFIQTARKKHRDKTKLCETIPAGASKDDLKKLFVPVYSSLTVTPTGVPIGDNIDIATQMKLTYEGEKNRQIVHAEAIAYSRDQLVYEASATIALLSLQTATISAKKLPEWERVLF